MPQIEGFRVKNYRALKDITLGRLWDQQNLEVLTRLVAVIGKNGTGKSTLFDAFGFLSDALTVGVEEACDLKGRGGYDRLVTSGSNDPIEFEVYYRERPTDPPITYELIIHKDGSSRPYVKEERLRQRRKGYITGRPFSFLHLKSGIGHVWTGVRPGGEGSKKSKVKMSDPRVLGIATLGTLQQHPRISAFRNFIQNWYLSYFTPDSARGLPLAGPQKHLNSKGDNLGNFVQYLARDHKKKFAKVLKRISEKIPGIENIEINITDDRRLLLRFNSQGFNDPFFAQQMSDGTLKMFTYLLLLEDPDPPPFICIEEPENGLYHKLMESLAYEFREFVNRSTRPGQIFVTTHQPYFVDALDPSETWILEKDTDGFSKIKRASDNDIVCAMVEEGRPLGNLWYSDYLDARLGDAS